MIVRTAAHYRSPPRTEKAPVEPAPRVRDFILIQSTPPTARVRDFILVDGLIGEPTRPLRITVADIQAATCAHFGLKLGDMTTDCRSVRIARPRQIAMALARELTPRSLTDIGVRFGNRDHTTVLHAIRAVARRVETDAEVRADRDAIAAAATLIAADRRREFAND